MSKIDQPSKSRQSIPLRTVIKVSVDLLDLDDHNPRLTNMEVRGSEEKIIAELYLTEDLNELLQSITANGYTDIEPFIVCKNNDRYTVLEGNRRLATVRLLRDPGLSNRIFEATRTRIRVPEIPQRYKDTLEQISAYRVAERKDADSFIGFKHINGAARWSSYAKAKFAARWYKESDLFLSEMANQIGDRHATVKRMVHAIHIFEQAEAKSLFDIEDCWNPGFSFSHLYTALSRLDYRKFLGLDPDWASYEPEPNPVPEENENLLTELLTWIYGSSKDEIAPVIKFSNPDIIRLGEVLDCSEALATLRTGKSLDQAHERTLSAEQKLRESLLLTRAKIREAFHNVRGFDIQDISLIAIADEISETAQAIHHQMKKKRKKFCKDAYG